MPPWDKYAQTAPAGDPVIAVDQYKVEDQQIQRDNAARAARDQQLQEQRFQQQQAREDKRDARAAEKDQQGTVEQGKAASFLQRAIQANQDYTKLGTVEPRSLPGQAFKDAFPNAANYVADGNQQLADQAERAFIAAVLRYDSGAAIPPEEFVTQGAIYFPRPGDSPAVLAQKAQSRLTALEGLRRSAGPAGQGLPELSASDPANTVVNGGEYDDQGNFIGLSGSVTDDTPSSPPPTNGNEPRSLFGSSLAEIDARNGGLAGLARRGVTMGLSDEAAGIGGFISDLLQAKNPIDGYRRENARVDAQNSRARRDYPILGTVAEIAGGGAGAGVNALAAIPSVARAAGTGAGLGALGGFGYGEGVQGSAVNALLGAGLGGALGAGGQAISNRLTGVGRPVPDMEVIAAGQRQNIPIRQPDARAELRGRYAAAESTQHGGPDIRAARAADADAIEARVADIGGAGTASDPYALGTQVQQASNRYIARTRQQANRLYDRARQEAGGQTVTARNADAVLDQNIQELTAAGTNSNAGAIRYLQGLRDDIDGGLTLESVQNLRTNMRGQLGEQGLTGTDTERRVRQVIDAMNQDLTDQLPQSASQALRAADDFYRDRQEFITGTLQQFMGSRGNPLPAETAAKRLVSMAQGKGNFERFSNMWRELEPTEHADAAATIAASLGRRQNGDFSPAMLIKSLDPRNGINPRTARLVFGDDGARALEDLRVIARAKGEAMNRQSPSGQAINSASGGLKTLFASVLGFGAGGPGGAAAGAVGREFLARWGEQRAARMLLNPDFTRWLRNAPNTTNPRAIDRYFGRLGGISSIAANDNQAFASAIREGFSRSPSRAAAETDEEQNRRRIPPQQ